MQAERTSTSPLTLAVDMAALRPLIQEIAREVVGQVQAERPSPEPGAAEDEPVLLDARAAAKVLSISPRQVARLTEAGELPHVRIGRLVRYRVDALKAWAQQSEQRIASCPAQG